MFYYITKARLLRKNVLNYKCKLLTLTQTLHNFKDKVMNRKVSWLLNPVLYSAALYVTLLDTGIPMGAPEMELRIMI